MSKISIKTDFTDGEKLFAQDLNNNFLVIQAGINANEENLQEVIDQAIIELDKQLEEITADRGWDWNGGDRVTFYKGNAKAIEAREIINGQLLYNTDSGETALDDNGTRVVTGSGNVVSVSEEEPTNPSTKIWVKPSKMARYAASYVVDSMEGTDTDKAPSVNAVKKYLKGDVLFENLQGDKTELTLLHSLNDYKRIKIFYFNGDINNSVEIDLSSGKKDFILTADYKSSISIIHAIARYKINGNKLTPQLEECGYFALNNSGTTMNWDNTNYSSIYLVIGYKEG